MSDASLRATGTRLEHRLVRFDPSRIQWTDAVRSTIVLGVPIAYGLATGAPATGVFLAIGCFNILLLQFSGTPADRLRLTGLGLLLNTAAIAAGTAVGSLGWIEVPLVAAGLVALHAANRIPRSWNLGFAASAMYVIGVGLPGSSLPEALGRGELALVGGLIALLGLAAQLLVARGAGRPFPREDAPWPPVRQDGSLPEWMHALAVGLTAALGLAIALALGLARDYWVMLTVVVVLRVHYEETIVTGSARLIGTLAGAGVGAAIVLAPLPPLGPAILLLAFAFGAFALQRANYLLYALALTAFVVLLLNLVYPEAASFAWVRVADTALGGALAMMTGALLWYARYRPRGPGTDGGLFRDGA